MPHKDPQQRRRYLAEYRQRRRQHRAEINKQWIEKNRESVDAYQADYRIKNKTALQDRYRKYYRRKRRTVLERNAAWLKAHPEAKAKADARRRTRMEVTVEDEAAIATFIRLVRGSKYVLCYYCERRVSGKRAHIDHIVPLAKGGPHSVANLCASCSHCNLSKKDKLLQSWRRDGQQILSL